MDSTRVDRWLWAIRVYKTRAESAAACRGGHVRINGVGAKPASSVAVGDRVEARAHDVDRTVEVARVIDKRVGAAVAVECYVDHTPPPPPTEGPGALVAPRERGSGRPTKRERRQLDRLRDPTR